MKKINKNEIFGRLNQDGNVLVLTVSEGEPVTRLDASIYPVGSSLSTRYEHPEGIVLSVGDAEKIGLEIEK